MNPARKLATLRRASQGAGLLSVMIACALGAGVLAVGFVVYGHASGHARVADGAKDATELAHRVAASFAASRDFATVSMTGALHDGLVPRSMLQAGQPVNPWGGSVDVVPLPSMAGFSVLFDGVPSSACAGLVAAAGPGFDAVAVSAASAFSTVASNGQVNTPATIAACANGPHAVRFDTVRGAYAPLPALVPCVAPAPQTQTVACPPGQVSSVPPYGPNGITQTRDASCGSPYGAPGWTPWATVGDTCAPICVPPPPAVSTATQWAPQSAACPPGWTGSHTWQAEQTQTTTVGYACPAPTGSATAQTPVVSAWAPMGPTRNDVNTCAAPPPPVCAPAPAVGAPTTAPAPSCPYGGTTTTTPGAYSPAPYPACWSQAPATVSTVCNPAPPPVCGPAPAVGAPTTAPAPSCPYGGTTTTTPGAWSAAPAPTCWTQGAPTSSTSCNPPPAGTASGLKMCALGPPSAGGQPQGTTCTPGSSVSQWNTVECVYSGTLTAGGSSGSFVLDVINAAAPTGYTKSKTQTVGGVVFTITTTTTTNSGCSGSVSP